MAKTIGRLGYVGYGVESVAGTAVSASVYLPYSDGPSLAGKHEPLAITSSRTSRNIDADSTVGKKWSEGDVQIDLDVVNSGYFFKVAFGNEMLETGTPNSHTFYTTVSGNTPKTATLIYGRDTDVEQYAYSAIDNLELNFSDGIATTKAAFKGKFPTTGTSQTVTTTSGTVVTFKDANVYFGSTLTLAEAASATAVNDFSITFANNLEVIHQSGSADVAAIRTKGFKCSGTYTLFFDAETDKLAHQNLNKRAMEVVFTGNANEQLRIRIPRFRLDEAEISTGLDDFFVVKGSFTAEDVVDSGARLVDLRLQNGKGTVY